MYQEMSTEAVRQLWDVRMNAKSCLSANEDTQSRTWPAQLGILGKLQTCGWSKVWQTLRRRETEIRKSVLQTSRLREHTHADLHTYMHTLMCAHTGRARNEPGQKIRFLGGFAMSPGLQSTTAWGWRRSRGMWRGGNGDTVIEPVQLLGRANGQSGNPTHFYCVCPSPWSSSCGKTESRKMRKERKYA